ncbi:MULTISPECIES: DNA topoisomerase (ATP-hydrolyzing) subunit A [unclassified Helicobacter]|uniref:DNA topoisomerase (ATP-hydrolyzing) subunit A n=1 Tax=unclassified Helicobacter TaxID=2593540 RepID=UPI000DCEB3F6|nr:MULTISPECIES: DNA topoisomerase (ATP-hydrolyzing) subunit A [unclassified Helicobacter]MCI7046584.1 DNA topoisomerase (ATP-hydrolyzing) subunit A [Helicobacter sp.]RAX53378.1 DNA gyrase subunit A [Helicobacter sp. 11-8110]
MSDLLNQDIQNVNIEDSIKESYLDYSMSVIVGRALPDARDGLKPVHRRILYAMYELGVTSKAKYKKSARIVGDVIGKYHPHGDTAVYDALVRMAQDFSMRLELVDGQGNFGSIDGDSAAAMRYTEAKMTQAAEEVLRDIDKDTVDFLPNYDDTLKEPDILPSRLPNLLVNGSNGIAVGMATNIPPHRIDEIIDALVYLIDYPKAELNEILQFIEGPDFPTGGIIYGRNGIREAYETGRGRIKIRAKIHIEKTKTKDIIVIDEIPYQVNKARLVEQIAELAKEKVIEGIAEVRDESDRDGIRVVVELKREAMSEIVLNHLFKSTPMESTFGIILLAIYNKEPKIFTLLELLGLFISHRKSVVIRRTIFELEKAKARAHILEGLRIALENIDEIVALIRSSSDPKVAKEGLIEKFNLSEIQAQAILDMRLQRLTGLERDKIENEYQELIKEIEYLSSILRSEELLNKIIKEELLEIKEKFSTKRLTAIEEDYESIDVEDLIPNEAVVVTMSHRGYVKRVPVRTYEKQNRGGKGKISANTHDDDFIESFFVSDTHDTIMFITNKGQLYWLKVYKIPEASRTAIGKAVVNLINLAPDEKIMATITTKDFNEDKSIAFFTKNGIIKRTNLSEFKNIRSVGVKAINLDGDDELVTAKIIHPEIQQILVVTYEGMCVRFGVDNVREIGRVARGVTAIKFKIPEDYVIGATVVSSENEEILSVSEKGIGKRTEVNEYRITNRGGKGVIAMKLTSKTGKLVGVVNVDENMDLMVLTSSGKMIRVDMQTIRKAGRATSGVIIVNVDDDKVVSIARCPKEEKEIEEDLPEGDNGLLEFNNGE